MTLHIFTNIYSLHKDNKIMEKQLRELRRQIRQKEYQESFRYCPNRKEGNTEPLLVRLN